MPSPSPANPAPHAEPKARPSPFDAPRPTDGGSANAYLRTKVLTAGPEELRLMLLDGAIKFARQGQEGLERRDFEASFNGLSQCREIITELMTSVRPDVDPDLCARVRSLYSFMFSELVEASLGKDAPRVGRIVELLEYERETWWMLMQQIAAERAGSPAERADAPERASPERRAPLSVQA
jgi:flagellar protein FliS